GRGGRTFKRMTDAQLELAASFLRGLGPRVDELVFQLLARLLREPLAGHEALGRATGVSGTATKARLERLAAEGVFNGFRGIPAPEVFGRQRRVFVFRKTGAGPEAVQEAIRVDPV